MACVFLWPLVPLLVIKYWYFPNAVDSAGSWVLYQMRDYVVQMRDYVVQRAEIAEQKHSL